MAPPPPAQPSVATVQHNYNGAAAAVSTSAPTSSAASNSLAGNENQESSDADNNVSLINSTRSLFTNPLGYRTEDDERVYLDGPYDFSDIYQGVHPNRRREPLPHSFYPTARVFENLSTSSFRLIWKISDHIRIVEDLEQHQLQSLKHSSPKLLWFLDTHNVPGSMKSLFPAVLLTAADDATTSSLIDLSNVSSTVVVEDDAVVVNADAHVNDSSTGDAIDDQQVVEIISCSSSPSVTRRSFEKSWYKELKSLYQLSANKSSVKMDIGGRGVIFQSFHYIDDENDSVSINSKTRKFEFVDALDDTLLYRWELKGCLAAILGVGKKSHERLFFALCRYKPNDSSSSLREFDCLAALVTRCSTRQPMFLMKDPDKPSAAVEEWKGWDLIKHYHAAPEVAVPFELLKEQRHVYFECNRYLYRKDKSILIDTHKPGAITEPNSRSELVERKERFWEIKAGLRPAIIVDSPSVLSGYKRGRGSSDDTNMGGDSLSLEAQENVPAGKKGRRGKGTTDKGTDDGGTTSSVNTNKQLQTDLKKSEAKVASLQRKIDKLQESQSEFTALQKELASLRKVNAKLHSENVSLSSSAQSSVLITDAPSNERILATIQKQMQEIARNSKTSARVAVESSSSGSGSGTSSTVDYYDDSVLADRRKRLNSAMQVEQLELEIQNIRESKVRSRARQSETELMQMHRQQVLNDRAHQRHDEDRTFYKEMLRQDAEHRQGREKTRDVIAMTSAANEPYTLQQLLAQQNRTIATPPLQIVQSPMIQLLATLLRSNPPPSADSSSVITEPTKPADVSYIPQLAMSLGLAPVPTLSTPPLRNIETNQSSPSVTTQQTFHQGIGIADRDRDMKEDDSEDESDQPTSIEELRLLLEREKFKIAENLALQDTLKK